MGLGLGVGLGLGLGLGFKYIREGSPIGGIEVPRREKQMDTFDWR